MDTMKPYFKFWSIMLFLSILLASLTPFMIQFPQYERNEHTNINETLTLSETNSTFDIDLTEGTYQLDIRHLVTNGSEIEIRAFNASTTFFKMSNITEIDDIPISIESHMGAWGEWESWNVSISRVSSDVLVSFNIRMWYRTRVLVDYAPLQNFGVFGIIFAGIGFYWFLSSDKKFKRKDKEGEEAEVAINPRKIASLILIAGLLFAPLIISLYQGQTIIRPNESIQKRAFNLNLNSTQPSLSITIEDISNEDAIDTYARVTVSAEQNSTFIVQFEEFENIIRYQIQYQKFVPEQSWILHIEDITRFSSVTMERLDEDVDLLIEVSVNFIVPIIEPNPIIASFLAIIGFIPLISAIRKSHKLDKEIAEFW